MKHDAYEKWWLNNILIAIGLLLIPTVLMFLAAGSRPDTPSANQTDIGLTYEQKMAKDGWVLSEVIGSDSTQKIRISVPSKGFFGGFDSKIIDTPRDESDLCEPAKITLGPDMLVTGKSDYNAHVFLQVGGKDIYVHNLFDKTTCESMPMGSKWWVKFDEQIFGVGDWFFHPTPYNPPPQ